MSTLNEVFREIAALAEEQNINLKNPDQRSLMWLRQKIIALTLQTRVVNRSIVRNEKRRNRKLPLLGKMYLFRYIPKTRAKLPFWDEFPLVVPIETVERPRNGFYGLNFHYMDPIMREKFLYHFLDFRSDDNFTGRSRIELTYRELKTIGRLRLFRPAFKRYLINRVASPLIKIEADEWMMAPFLPLEEFQKASKQSVWADSRRKV